MIQPYGRRPSMNIKEFYIWTWNRNRSTIVFLELYTNLHLPHDKLLQYEQYEIFWKSYLAMRKYRCR